MNHPTHNPTHDDNDVAGTTPQSPLQKGGRAS